MYWEGWYIPKFEVWVIRSPMGAWGVCTVQNLRQDWMMFLGRLGAKPSTSFRTFLSKLRNSSGMPDLCDEITRIVDFTYPAQYRRTSPHKEFMKILAGARIGIEWNDFWTESTDSSYAYQTSSATASQGTKTCKYHGEVLETIPTREDGVTEAAASLHRSDAEKRALAQARWQQNYGKYARGMPLCEVAAQSVPVEIEVVYKAGNFVIQLACPHCRSVTFSP